jgi:hypothetical protein
MAYPPGSYPPGAYPAYPPGAYSPGAYPAHPPGAYPEAPEDVEPAAPAIAPHRPIRFRADFGMGGFNPKDVNEYMKSQIPSNAYQTSGFSEMIMLMSASASVAYYPARFFGVRANGVYLFAPKVITVQGGTTEGFWLHSLAPALSLDFAFDQGKLARFFASPGIAYQVAWFEGYGASGLGLTLALGAELSFGQSRAKGISISLVLRKADLDIESRPSASSSVPMNSLDFTSVLVCVGFQTGM